MGKRILWFGEDCQTVESETYFHLLFWMLLFQKGDIYAYNHNWKNCERVLQLWFFLLSSWERLPKKQILAGSELSKSNILKHGKFQKTCLSIQFWDIRMWLTVLKLNKKKNPKIFSFKWLNSNVTPESDLASKVHIQSYKASSISAWKNQAGGGAEWLPGCNCALWPLKCPQDNSFLAAGGGSSNGHFLLPSPSYKLWLGL